MTPEIFNHYKVGIAAVDNGHWIIIDQLNHIKRLIRHGSTGTDLISLMDSTISFTLSEMQDEEHWMETTKYPAYHYHADCHKKLLVRLMKIREYVMSDHLHGLHHAISEWQRKFTDQIDHHDFQWVKFYQKLDLTEYQSTSTVSSWSTL